MYLSKKSTGIYHIFYKDSKGNRRSKTTKCKHKNKANIFLTAFKKELLHQKKNPIILISFEHFKIKFLAYSETIYSWNHTKSMHSVLNGFHSYYGNVTLSTLTKSQVQTYIEHRLKKVSPHAVRRDIHTLSSAFKWAITKKYMKKNLTKGLPLPKLSEKLPKYFSYEEFNTLLNNIQDKDLLDIINFAISTGLRQSDIINLRWEQITLSNRTFVLDNRFSLTKSRKVHILPLNKTAMEILIRREQGRSLSFVFTYQGKRVLQCFISHKFKKIIVKAKINPALTFHTLRHTFATRLVQKGVPLYHVSKLLTHSDIKVTQIYAHLCTQDLFDAVKVLD
jgi:integrase